MCLLHHLGNLLGRGIRGFELVNRKFAEILDELRIDEVDVEPFRNANYYAGNRRDAKTLAKSIPESNIRSRRLVSQIIRANINSRREEKIPQIASILADAEIFAVQSQRELQHDINENHHADEEAVFENDFHARVFIAETGSLNAILLKNEFKPSLRALFSEAIFLHKSERIASAKSASK